MPLSLNVVLGTHVFRIAMCFMNTFPMRHTQNCVTLQFEENPSRRKRNKAIVKHLSGKRLSGL